MEEFTNVIKEISLSLQRKDADAVWCFEQGILKEKMRYELEGICFIQARYQNKQICYCFSRDSNQIELKEQHTIWGKKQSTEEDSLMLDIARDWILKKIKVIMEMVTFSHCKGESEALMEWSFLPDKKTCRAIAMLLPKMLQDEGFSFRLRAECIDNGDGIVLSW